MKARWAILQMMKNSREFFDEEFMEFVFPILEIALQWEKLSNSCMLPSRFIKKCKERFAEGASSNFLGVAFEIDVAMRCFLSGWKIKFAEDYTGKKKQIEFVIEKQNGEKIGLECTSKKASEKLDVSKINDVITDKNQKFDPKFLSLFCPCPLVQKILIIDITRKNYRIPSILEALDQISIGSNLDSVVLTWREDVRDEKRHSLRIKYKSLGNMKDTYFSTTWAAELCPPTKEKGAVFFLRKYIEPEPSQGGWGPEETFEEYKKKN